MALARHSDRRLSDYVYTDTNQLPLATIVQALPNFSPIQIATQTAGPAGRELSQTDACRDESEGQDSKALRGEMLVQAQTVAESHTARWCAMQGSNLRLLACEASALPLS